MRKLRAFLKGNCDMNDEREAVVFEELLRGARLAAIQLADVFEYLDNLGVRLKSQRDVERFTALYNAFHNTTRMPCNRGYTPDEMMRWCHRKKASSHFLLVRTSKNTSKPAKWTLRTSASRLTETYI